MSAEEADAFMAELQARAHELVAQGKPFPVAMQLAGIDDRIRCWPPAWGDMFEALIYGDIVPPKASLKHPDIQIEIHPEPLKNTIISGASCVLRASVAVNEKSFGAVVDATRRLNLLLGSYILHNWGNSALGWWSFITHGNNLSTIAADLETYDLGKMPIEIGRIENVRVRSKVEAALYWIREPRAPFLHGYRRDTLRIYAAYWNAFECLVDAVNKQYPIARLTDDEKAARISITVAVLI